MKRPSDTELISLTEKHDVVTFRWEDGATADVTRDVVAKSTLLHTTLSDATPGDDIKLTIETGVVQQWLHAVLDEPYQLKMLKVCILPPSTRVGVNSRCSCRIDSPHSCAPHSSSGQSCATCEDG